METVQVKFGHENIVNYKRLSYKWWYAFAEFVDNSSQSYFDHQDALDKALANDQERFRVAIVTEDDECRISDNAMGMDLGDLQQLMNIGVPRENTKGRCRYGLGMKTAACWIGNGWEIVTTKLGCEKEYTLKVNVNDIAVGKTTPPVAERDVEKGEHYTIIKINDHNRPLKGPKTISTIKKYLRSIYRQDVSSGTMLLTYNGVEMEWAGFSDSEFLKRIDGSLFREGFEFHLDSDPSKKIKGWVAVLYKGSRTKAGFSVFQENRVVKGWPESWRPRELFGDWASNDLVNQRLVGEIYLSGFDVSHTKDEIDWYGGEEEEVGEKLKELCWPYRETARKMRKNIKGPAPAHVAAAVQILQQEITTPEFMDQLSLEEALPPEEQLAESNHQVVVNAEEYEPEFSVKLGESEISVFLDSSGSPNDPYVVHESKDDDSFIVVINIQHPHFNMLEGQIAVVNYFRHCVYDGLAEFRAVQQLGKIQPDTVKRLKDGYLRVAFEVQEHEGEESPEGED